MKTILLLSVIFLFFGCATKWDTRRQQLDAAYKEGKISAEAYFKLKADIDKEELAATDPYAAQLLELEEIYKAGKISASEYIQAKHELTKSHLEQQRREYEDSQRVAEAIRKESDRQTEEFNQSEQQRFDNQIKLMNALQGNRVTTDCYTDQSGYTHCK